MIAALLAGCASGPQTAGPDASSATPSAPPSAAPPTGVLPGPLTHPKTRWVPVDWAELPGFSDDAVHEAWGALMANCQRPNAAIAPLCAPLRRLAIATDAEQRVFLMEHLQPYRVESPAGQAEGLLTSYYEPVFDAARQPSATHRVPLYGLPAGWVRGRQGFTRQQLETLPEAQATLRGREIAWMADPVDALMLHIQGSGRLRITEADGRQQTVRLAFAGTNEQPYRSVQAWLSSQGVSPISRWPEDVKAWAQNNPHRVQQMLWANPRYVFFREESLADVDMAFGPRGAQGVPLTAGRSIAVDREAIPYGTPVWLQSIGPTAQLQRLVVAQDTGSAIVGAVRADYFAGTGEEAGRFAARMKQPLRLWALWPRGMDPTGASVRR
ncbi:MltA domain-containing protein [Xenophilus arseniciresistens]|uniref:peptidoglycan lytic exotransglycosylase n=1 Tax=Xenophilus arseniciresistens TaxID=1283306 RepID=A0AAE3NBN6_9BURK|nr:MltA domain-containing protein [Xenophilus arseniciresistens]MDA7418403.1 MltA domain-containing protein [Xenophilus arseniciresistens]